MRRVLVLRRPLPVTDHWKITYVSLQQLDAKAPLSPKPGMVFQRQKGSTMLDTSTNEQPLTNRAETNRENAQKSTGPRTEAGKQRSSLNALRHGLTGQTVVLPSDDLIAYQRHCQQLHDQYHPKNPMEAQLTQAVADLSWRLNRITALETNMLTLGITEHSSSVDTENEQVHNALAMAKAFCKQSNPLANLSLNKHRLSIPFHKPLNHLQEMQEARRSQEKSDMFDAARILQMHKDKKIPYNPVEDGFVVSNAEIETFIRRRDRDREALRAAS